MFSGRWKVSGAGEGEGLCTMGTLGHPARVLSSHTGLGADRVGHAEPRSVEMYLNYTGMETRRNRL